MFKINTFTTQILIETSLICVKSDLRTHSLLHIFQNFTQHSDFFCTKNILLCQKWVLLHPKTIHPDSFTLPKVGSFSHFQKRFVYFFGLQTTRKFCKNNENNLPKTPKIHRKMKNKTTNVEFSSKIKNTKKQKIPTNHEKKHINYHFKPK